MSAYGNTLEDILPFVVVFADLTQTMSDGRSALCGFAMNCDHGGSHVMTPKAFKLAARQFMKDHPFGVTPEPLHQRATIVPNLLQAREVKDKQRTCEQSSAAVRARARSLTDR